MSAAYLIRGVQDHTAFNTVGVATATEALAAVQRFRTDPQLMVTIHVRTGAIVGEKALQWRARCERALA